MTRSSVKPPVMPFVGSTKSHDRRSVQETHQDRFNNPTEEKKLLVTQQQNNSAVAVAENQQGYELLTQAGFDQRTARRLAAQRLTAEIEQQIRWLPQSQPSQNPLGMLRRAIEESWSAPASAESKVQQVAKRKHEDQLQQQQLREDPEIEILEEMARDLNLPTF